MLVKNPAVDPRQRERNLLVNTLRILLWIIGKVFYAARWIHYERVPMSGPVILAPNHQSFIDPPAVAVPLWRRVYYFTRDVYFKKFPLGPIIRYLKAFPVDIERRFDSKAYEQARRILNDGGMLVLFPEGVRTNDGLVGRIQPGVASLAVETGATIVPVTICGAFEAWPRTRSFPRLCCPIRIKYHNPIPVERIEDPHKRRAKVIEISRQLERILSRRPRAWHRLFHKDEIADSQRPAK